MGVEHGFKLFDDAREDHDARVVVGGDGEEANGEAEGVGEDGGEGGEVAVASEFVGHGVAAGGDALGDDGDAGGVFNQGGVEPAG